MQLVCGNGNVLYEVSSQVFLQNKPPQKTLPVQEDMCDLNCCRKAPFNVCSATNYLTKQRLLFAIFPTCCSLNRLLNTSETFDRWYFGDQPHCRSLNWVGWNHWYLFGITSSMTQHFLLWLNTVLLYCYFTLVSKISTVVTVSPVNPNMQTKWNTFFFLDPWASLKLMYSLQ